MNYRDYIARDKNGVPQIVGANTKVVELVMHVQSYQETPEEVCEALPHLSLEQVHAALAFYDEHREEIDQAIRDWIEYAERMERELGQPPWVEELARMEDVQPRQG